LGELATQEFIKRLIFNVLIANNDMHLKNWSLIYPDATTPQLAPAYDYVATHVFLEDTKMALSMAGEKDMQKLDSALLKRFAEKAKLPNNMVIQAARETVDKTLAAWKVLNKNLPLAKKMREVIEKKLFATASQFQ
jgi:serine/threonine-protein kinase HipA